MRYILIITLTLIINIAFASEVLVIVDGKAITTVDLKKRIEALKLMYPNFTDDLNSKKQILNNLVSEELFHNEAEKLKVSISDEEIDDRFKEIQQENHLSDAQVKTWISNKALRQQVEGQLLWSKLVSAVFYSKIKVSEAEIHDEQKVKSEEIKEVDFKQLLFKNFESEKVNQVAKEVTDCNNFDSIVQKYGFSRPYHNVLLYQDLNPELQAIIKGLPINKVSDILQFNAQNQIIIICNKKVTHKTLDARVIRQELSAKKINAEAQKYLSELKKRIYVEYITPIE